MLPMLAIFNRSLFPFASLLWRFISHGVSFLRIHQISNREPAMRSWWRRCLLLRLLVAW